MIYNVLIILENKNLKNTFKLFKVLEENKIKFFFIISKSKIKTKQSFIIYSNL